MITIHNNVATPYRMISGRPVEYRLAQVEEGRLVLQGLFEWTEYSANEPTLHGGDWRNIPVVDLLAAP